jgi:site-specific DNA-methyltransferase (adenine-specific)
VKKWTTQHGVMYLGDCLDVMKSMEDKSVDFVFGSPPYEDARLYMEEGKDLNIARGTEEWVAWMIEVVKESLRVCKGLVAFVVGHGKGARRWSGGPALLCADLIRAGYCLRRPAWYKRNGIMGSGGNDWLRADLEFIVCITNDDKKLPWSDNVACGHPPKFGPGGTISQRLRDGSRMNDKMTELKKLTAGRNMTRRAAAKKLGVKMTASNGYRNGDIVTDNKYVPPEKSNPGDVIDCGNAAHIGSNIGHENEAPFPEKLPNFFVRSFCPPDGVVFDPFGGSGTTLAVAIKTGRKFITCDLRESQIKLMLRRVKQADREKGLFQS